MGMFGAIEDGTFGDVRRRLDEGRGIDGIVDTEEGYFNPASELMRGARQRCLARAAQVDLTRVKPYADHLGDGIVQLSFTLPVPDGLAARKAALELAGEAGLRAAPRSSTTSA